MRTTNKVGVGFLILFIAISVAATITSIRSQQTPPNAAYQRAGGQDDVPVAEYSASLPTDSREKQKRIKRNQRRNIRLGPETGVLDPTRFMITERSESGYGGFESHASPQPAIPAAQSDVVVKGKITKAEAFLSEDKVSIYSEFTMKVDSLLKNTTSAGIESGDSITISRGGGAVRLPSGKVIKRLFDGKRLPRVGAEYVMFLKFEPEGEDYSLITAYELTDGKVVPLDGVQLDGQIVPELSSHRTYLGTPESEFLRIVQEAVFQSKDIFEKEAR